MTTPVHTLDPDEVQVGSPNGPGLYIAPAGTAAPTDTTSAWPSPWKVLGYLSDDGPTVGQNTTKQDLTPWQSIAPIRSVITNREVTLHFVLWQLNDDTLALYFDTDVPTPAVDGSLTLDVRTDQSGHLYALGVDAEDNGRVLRIVFERASLSDAGDMPIKRGETVPLECTLTALEANGSLATIMLGPTAGTTMASAGASTSKAA